jgi:2-polyprenyl-3-methyl-5-hydroxy-6-metoxy-1,4-benzoquinol methylase
MRRLEAEHEDSAHRKYAYDFDYLMHDYMLRVFAPFIGAGAALELGCYHGAFTQRLAERFADLTVVEGAADLIEIARAAVPQRVRFFHRRFEEFSPPQGYDAIFLIHTLEHLDEAVASLDRFRQWLAPGGRLFVAVPNAHAASRQIAVEMGLIAHPSAVTPDEHRHGHRRTYARATLADDLRAAGLSVVQEGGIFFKALANFQFDAVMKQGIVDAAYLEGCFRLGMRYPDLCASIYAICEAR